MSYDQVLDIIGLDTGALQVLHLEQLEFLLESCLYDNQQYITLGMLTLIDS